MSSFRYVVVDVFTDTPLQGNQLAVFTDARDIPEEQLQPLARELNYSETPFGAADEILAALGAQSQLPVELYDNGVPHVFVALRDESEVAALVPDVQRLARVGPYGINCFAGSGSRWRSRMFGAGPGVPEGPATSP